MKYIFIIFIFSIMGCQTNNDKSIPIEPLKNYALDYNPCIEGEGCPPMFHLPELPNKVNKIIESRKVDDELILYNTLIMLKLYRAQLERAHQSYDLRGEKRNHPILAAFSKYSRSKVTGEFVSSDISYVWAKEQVKLVNNPSISIEIKRIEKVLSNIKDGI